jgi:hypothetical protein
LQLLVGDNAATGTVALQSDLLATALGTHCMPPFANQDTTVLYAFLLILSRVAYIRRSSNDDQ